MTTPTPTSAMSAFSNADYCNKVNAEYEAIKRSILAKDATVGLTGIGAAGHLSHLADYDNLANYKLEEPQMMSTGATDNAGLVRASKNNNLDTFINSQLATLLTPINHTHLTTSYYDNLNEHSAADHDVTARPAAANIQLYDNLENLQVIDAEKVEVNEPVVYKMSDLVVEEIRPETTTTAPPENQQEEEEETTSLTRSELDEIIDKLNDMQNVSTSVKEDEYPITTTTAAAGSLNLTNLTNLADTSNLSSSSSINSLNRIDEYARHVSEKYASPTHSAEAKAAHETGDGPVPADASVDILNDIIQQVMSAQEQVQRLDENNKAENSVSADFTWENLMSSDGNNQNANNSTTDAGGLCVCDDSCDGNFNWEKLMSDAQIKETHLSEEAATPNDDLDSISKGK
jgi:hypothetical protein